MRRRGSGDLLSLLLIAALLVGAYYYFYLPSQTSLSGMSLTVTYTDGTSTTVDSPNIPLLPNSVTDGSGKEISGISYVIRATPTYTGTAASTSVTGNVVILVDGVAKRTTALTYGTKILSGVTTQVGSDSVTAPTIEGYNTAGGSHTLTVRADLSMAVTYTDSPTSTKTNSNTGVVSYVVSTNGISALSIQVTASTYGGL
jgi:hypothetical protein